MNNKQSKKGQIEWEKKRTNHRTKTTDRTNKQQNERDRMGK